MKQNISVPLVADLSPPFDAEAGTTIVPLSPV